LQADPIVASQHWQMHLLCDGPATNDSQAQRLLGLSGFSLGSNISQWHALSSSILIRFDDQREHPHSR
jgi:hypothetical protein